MAKWHLSPYYMTFCGDRTSREFRCQTSRRTARPLRQASPTSYQHAKRAAQFAFPEPGHLDLPQIVTSFSQRPSSALAHEFKVLVDLTFSSVIVSRGMPAVVACVGEVMTCYVFDERAGPLLLRARARPMSCSRHMEWCMPSPRLL